MENFSASTWRHYDLILRATQIEIDLEALKNLGNNWSVMNEGIPISEQVIEYARALYFNLRNLNFGSFEVQPGLSGEVLLGAQYAGNAVELIVNQDLSLEFFLEKNGVEVESNVDLSHRELLQELKELSGWNTSEYSTQNIIKNQNQGTQSWLSSLHSEMEESLSLALSAQFHIVEKSAPTFVVTIAA